MAGDCVYGDAGGECDALGDLALVVDGAGNFLYGLVAQGAHLADSDAGDQRSEHEGE